MTRLIMNADGKLGAGVKNTFTGTSGFYIQKNALDYFSNHLVLGEIWLRMPRL